MRAVQGYVNSLSWYPVVEVVVFVEIDMSLSELIVSLLEFILCGLFSFL